MLLTLTTTATDHGPATDLGYLLGKNPSRVQSFELSAGKAHVFYPEATAERCTAALLLDLDPLDLVRNARKGGSRGLLTHYVNDRPYVASSFLSVAINRVLGSALGGRSRERQELADTAIPLEATVSALPARGGEGFVRGLFEPLGYEVEVASEPLDPVFEDWGQSRYVTLSLRAETRLADLLSHLYVLVPVLDDDKHYWVGREEIDKLLARGGEWLKAHPLREAITRRYLKRQRGLTREALSRLTADEAIEEPELEHAEARMEGPLKLSTHRMAAVVAELRQAGAKRVADVGCGEGRLLRALLKEPSIEKVLGMDVSVRALERAARRLHLEEMPERKRSRIELMQGSMTYRDRRLQGFDALCAIEVIEHLEPSRLEAFARAIFETAAPPLVVVTTPNVEHNVRFESLPAGRMRHHDHRFEWTRAEFRAWAAEVGERFGYTVRHLPVGTEDPEVGPPTQMAVFDRSEEKR
jgi:3' terminal RNA ribose 2'-O-methyltransferase Hen1